MEEMDKFKDSQGRWRTKSLFHETAFPSKEFVVYTLDQARILFLSFDDPTGYQFATECLGGWKHWLALKASPTIAPKIAEWEEELEVKLRAYGLSRIIDHARGDKGYQASKFLADKGWQIREGAGRPSKEEIEHEKKVQSKMYSEFDNVIEYKK